VEEAPHYNAEVVELLKQKKIRLVVVRHGEGIHNLLGLMTSTRSPGVHLTEKGIQQVQATAAQLKQQGIQADKIYVSPVYRTLQTAQMIASGLDLPYQKVAVEDRLREQFFGHFEDHLFADYLSYFDNPEDAFAKAAPGGESGAAVFQRTVEFLRDIGEQHQEETIVLITHAFNHLHISMCLQGEISHKLKPADYRIYDFAK
jgi:probable phosphoglycerate mutase